jgi:TonB family protein
MLAGQNMTETEIWSKWESQVVNGVFPLRRFLGRSNHSVVFLTECRRQNLPNAAIKIIPEDPALAENQLARWRAAAGLSHPHVMRILDSGRCKLGGHPFLFVVSEYAEQNLAQILPHRGLTSDEAREMLAPTLDALEFLHGQGLVHGQLQPPNLLVVDDQVKLSSDGIRPRGEPSASAAKPSPYDAPEAKNGAIGLAGDVWSLGATLMEALTQIPPGPHDDAGARLPSSLPMAFAEFVRRCLSNDPARRPTIPDLKNLLDPPPEARAPASEIPSAVPPEGLRSPEPGPARPMDTPRPIDAARPIESTRAATRESPRQPPARTRPPLPQWLVPAVIGFVMVMAIWLSLRAMHTRAATQAPVTAPSASASPTAVAQQTPPIAPLPTSAVLHEETPAISRGARESIRGQIKVVVRVTVDRSGNVTGENTEVRGSSRYFARLAADAARKWKFAPADNATPREWLIQFDFARDGISAHAVQRGKQ